MLIHTFISERRIKLIALMQSSSYHGDTDGALGGINHSRPFGRHGCLHRRPRERSERKRVTSTETYGLIGRGMNAQVSFYQAVSPGPTRLLHVDVLLQVSIEKCTQHIKLMHFLSTTKS